jgi:hypothetical protein
MPSRGPVDTAAPRTSWRYAPRTHDPFVLTTAHLEGGLRGFDDGAVQELPPGFDAPLCDFCVSKVLGLGLTETTAAGLRHATCPVCRTEFLSDY